MQKTLYSIFVRIVTALVYLFVKLWILFFDFVHCMQYTLENKWWKHNASFFRGFMTTNARVVLKSICCTISSWFNDSHFLCFFLRFPTILWIMGHCPKIRRIQLLMLTFGAKIQIDCRWAKSLSFWISVLFFSHFLGEKRSFIAFLLLRVPPVVVIIVSHFAWIYECVRNYPTTLREAKPSFMAQFC